MERSQQEKLASMKELMDNIAHQWRQPLSQINSIVGIIDNHLHAQGIKDSFVEQKLIEIEKLTHYMSETIDDFKGYFNEDDEKVLFDISSVLEEACAIVQPALDESSITLRVALLSDEKEYFGYANELKQIIIVLLNNAKDILQTRNITSAKIELSLSEDKEYLIIAVCDNGRGMTKNLMKRVFEPYFTTKHKSQGTGLGLYMSQKMIQNRFNGEIKVNNIEDGICFSIYLPKGVC
jgi:C4-dicarboxylate-specific signal transduction histidine kinase